MRAKASPRVARVASTVLTHLLLLLLAFTCIIPFYYMLASATQTNTVIMTSFTLSFGGALGKNFASLSSVMNVGRVLLNSLIIAGVGTIITLYFGSLTAYGFAKFKFRLNKPIFMAVLCTMMLPSQLGIIGFFQLMTKMRLLDSYFPIWLPGIANASCVFFLRQYCKGYVPNSIIESGRIDGMHELGIFHRLAIPMMAPAIATQAIFLFVAGWNNFFGPMLFLFSPEKYPIVLAVQQLNGLLTQDFGAIYLSLAISIIPILILFFLVSRFIMGGLALGSVKE